jgi:tetratricopeptide (TPR) repeat protein
MRAPILVLLCFVAACKPPSAEVPPPAVGALDAGPAIAAEPPPDVGNADDLYQRAYMLKGEHPGEAIRLYKKAAELAPNDAPLQAKVKAELKQFEGAMRDRAREAYLFGFELKNSSPNDAARNFEQAMDLTPRGDPLHEKAKAQLSSLKKK